MKHIHFSADDAALPAMKKEILKLWLLILAALTLVMSAFADSRPNIVFILMDDLRWDALSCMGHPVAKTPNIDRIAKEGALFKNFFVSIPLCAPSRSSFLTGQYAHTTGVTDNADHSALSHKLQTFPKLLHEAGYDAGYIGKWHMGTDATPRPGFDYWVCLHGQGQYENPALNINGQEQKVEGYCTDIFNEHAVKFIKQERTKPFVLYLAHKAVHGPFTPAERHKDLYANAGKFPQPPNLSDSLEGKPALTRKGEGIEPKPGESAEPPGKKKARQQQAREEGRVPGPGIGQLRALAAVDDGVGMILKALEETKQLDNTIVVFSSDNGYFWGEHGLGDKRWAYEESIRDPLLIRYPKLIKAGTTIEPMAMNIDLAATFLELGGASVLKDIEGKSLVPLLKNKQSKVHDAIFTEYFHEKAFPRTPSWKAIRTTDWKYIHYTDLSGMDELYNIKSDPYELKNLIADPKAKKTLADLQARLQKFGQK